MGHSLIKGADTSASRANKRLADASGDDLDQSSCNAPLMRLQSAGFKPLRPGFILFAAKLHHGQP